MSHQRDPRVTLAAAEPRCTPAFPCLQKQRCARYLAPLPPAGASMIGHDLPPPFYSGSYCPRYLKVSMAPKTAAPTAPTVKPPVKGIA